METKIAFNIKNGEIEIISPQEAIDYKKMLLYAFNGLLNTIKTIELEKYQEKAKEYIKKIKKEKLEAMLKLNGAMPKLVINPDEKPVWVIIAYSFANNRYDFAVDKDDIADEVLIRADYKDKYNEFLKEKVKELIKKYPDLTPYDIPDEKIVLDGEDLLVIVKIKDDEVKFRIPKGAWEWKTQGGQDG
ncbi:hypothetical protein [Caminibacter mediatlanticus]|uniref:Uncharacterized protein n=2 Tax=Caminibacter mediatlanticus TB-2 TaxID=391592 RepID=A0AAI9AG04_9BACT|nr:hypothetical protein [Caminibacter mediatlanticus]EDM22947.1 hypothetical protein CMTB2_05562 [Caminibacter mediatlanticus TB-2]